MSTFKNMSKQSIKDLISKIFTNIEKETDQIAYIIVSPEDWTYLKVLTDFIDFSTQTYFFEKGHCGSMWGAQIWLNKGATDVKLYTESQWNILENEQPIELINAIEEYKIESNST